MITELPTQPGEDKTHQWLSNRDLDNLEWARDFLKNYERKKKK